MSNIVNKLLHHDKTHAKTHHHKGAVPVVGTGAAAAVPVAAVPVAAVPVAPLATNVVHEPEKVINHQPILEKEIIRENPVEVKREHHIQPIIHETVHQIQPIIKTQATTETPVIVQDRNVMLPPIVEAPVVVNRGAPLAAAPVVPAAVATTTLPRSAVAPVAAPLAAAPLVGAPVAAVPVVPVAAPLGMAAGPKPTAGQKLKGALKQVQGNITNNPATIEEGKLLASGVDPLTAKTITHPTTTTL